MRPDRSFQHYRRGVLALAVVVPAAVAVYGAVGLAVFGGGGALPLGAAFALLPVALAFGVIVDLVLRRPGAGGPGALTRLLIALPATVAVVVTAAVVSAAVTVPATPVLAGAVVLGIALGALAWGLAPTPPAVERRSGPVEPLALRPGERVVWVGTAHADPVLTGVLIAVLAVVAIVAVLVAATAGQGALVLLAVPLLLAVVAGLLSWHVRIDDTGVRLRAGLGLPTVRLPLHTIVGADVRTVVPVGDFGGYGIRNRRGVTAFVTRAGDALEIERGDGHRVLVTVDRAEEAASVLAGLTTRV